MLRSEFLSAVAPAVIGSDHIKLISSDLNFFCECACVCVNKTEKQALKLCIACHCALWQSPVGSSHKTLKLFYPNQCGTSSNKWPSGFKRWKKETQVFKLTFYIENHLFSCVPSGEDMKKKSTASLTLHSSGCGDNINHPVCQHLCDGWPDITYGSLHHFWSVHSHWI